MTILVFDSGIGGLTVLRELRVMMPEQHFIYVVDDRAFPYGDWKAEELHSHILELFDQLIECFEPEMVIIACNTASTLMMKGLRARFPGVKFVGTVPAIKPAAEQTRSGLVSVLATPGTVEREYTRDLVRSFASQCHVRLIGSANLASFAEAHIRRESIDSDELLAEIFPCFVELDGKRTDIIVLACTHFPFLANEFRKLAPWPVDWLNPAEAIARHSLSLVEPPDEAQIAKNLSRFDEAIFTSGKSNFTTERLLHGFGLRIADSASSLLDFSPNRAY